MLRSNALDRKLERSIATPGKTMADASEGLLSVSERRVRARMLVLLRWMAVAGQTITVLIVELVLHFDLNLALCLGVIATSAWLNTFLSAASPGQRYVDDREAAAQLAFDIIQLSTLVALTGGLDNPFAVLLGVPVMIASTILRPFWVVALGLLAAAATLLMMRFKGPLPWDAADMFNPPLLYEAGLWTAVVSGAGFMSVFAWRLAADARAMSTALAATEMVLAREQRLSALGGLAAAAAHELGTPLATIQIVATELARSAPEGSEVAADAALLVQQSERCREILRQLARRGDAEDEVHARVTLGALLEEVAEPLRELGPEVDIRIETASAGELPAPHLKRSPEMLYALGNLLDNAMDHAREKVVMTGRWSSDWIEIEIVDDGPGFPPDILAKLGEPYVTSRAVGTVRGGLGLGFFIAKLFVERTGGALVFGNRRPPDTGAVVRASWPLDMVRDGPAHFEAA
jgi:two-component system sensor histidine kinase RegB